MSTDRSSKEIKELERLRKQSTVPAVGKYLLFVMIVLTVVYIVDEITSNVNAAMQPYTLLDLFSISSGDVNSPEYKAAFNTVTPWQVASNLFLIISPFYKALADKYGQVLFLVLQNFIPMDILFLIICVPFMAISLLILITKVRETKDADLDNITADTYR